MGKTAPVFDTMLQTARNPAADVGMKVDGSLYLCPWVEGPGELSTPFGLETKYGYLVLVFVRDSPTYQQFRDISAGALADGYTMKSAGIVANSDRQLADAIALRLPAGTRPHVVVEGTDEFARCWQELRDDTIWPQ
jgi:hypothetical protein